MVQLRIGNPSCFQISKGACIQATYVAFAQWDLEKSDSENIRSLRETNPIGAPSYGWLKDFGKVLSRRFDCQGFDRPLVELAQEGCDLTIWKPLLLWHMSRTDPVVFEFFTEWLFREHSKGIHRLTTPAAIDFLTDYIQHHLGVERLWSPSNLQCSAASLLKMGVDFSLLKGRRIKEFTAYHLPEQSFMYLLHAMMDELGNAGRLIESPDWRMFLMTRQDVEAELYRLHQFRKLRFESAGSLAQLELPCTSVAEYTRRLVV
jgi:hypothetical protein